MMLSFHSSPENKSAVLTRLANARKAGWFRVGSWSRGWSEGTLMYGGDQNFDWGVTKDGHTNKNREFETNAGIPDDLAFLFKKIFRELPPEEQSSWPEKAITACPVGCDLTGVPRKFAAGALALLPTRGIGPMAGSLTRAVDLLTIRPTTEKIEAFKQVWYGESAGIPPNPQPNHWSETRPNGWESYYRTSIAREVANQIYFVSNSWSDDREKRQNSLYRVLYGVAGAIRLDSFASAVGAGVLHPVAWSIQSDKRPIINACIYGGYLALAKYLIQLLEGVDSEWPGAANTSK